MTVREKIGKISQRVLRPRYVTTWQASHMRFVNYKDADFKYQESHCLRME